MKFEVNQQQFNADGFRLFVPSSRPDSYPYTGDINRYYERKTSMVDCAFGSWKSNSYSALIISAFTQSGRSFMTHSHQLIFMLLYVLGPMYIEYIYWTDHKNNIDEQQLQNYNLCSLCILAILLWVDKPAKKQMCPTIKYFLVAPQDYIAGRYYQLQYSKDKRCCICLELLHIQYVVLLVWTSTSSTLSLMCTKALFTFVTVVTFERTHPPKCDALLPGGTCPKQNALTSHVKCQATNLTRYRLSSSNDSFIGWC
jgi:hypothetical protein